MCADLDKAYYALLEHHLSCGYDTPPVPPPHVYFPALARAHPGVAERLLTLYKVPLVAAAATHLNPDMRAGLPHHKGIHTTAEFCGW